MVELIDEQVGRIPEAPSRQSDGRRETYASDFFPDTPFEKISGAVLRFSVREGDHSTVKTVTKRTNRWRGYSSRRQRAVEYLDLRRIQPVGARAGYGKLLKHNVNEGSHSPFDDSLLSRYSTVMGKQYDAAGISLTDVDSKKKVPVMQVSRARYSGFHQGAGEIAAAELLVADYPRYGLVVIDEIETSLHPRAQRRLMRDLATVARRQDIQFIVSTHSSFILNELPERARAYIINNPSGRRIVTGVSPEFAMTQMDEEAHPECDIYVEDDRSAAMLSEILVAVEPDLSTRVMFTPYGSASVGNTLGIMKFEGRFSKPTLVFLDGDQESSRGCHTLPGKDAPERVVLGLLKKIEWEGIAERIGRDFADTYDALGRATSLADHHEWLREAANWLRLGSDHLWQALCAEYSGRVKDEEEVQAIVQKIKEEIDGGTRQLFSRC
ncbi:MAG: AAA family ATPase [Spirochaetaceae bacterium]|nr:AAA family ATPase [Spirochaetaceae bacterium]